MSLHRGTRQGRWRHARVLEERDPSLINLPFPIPSIPILTPLLSPLISGSDPDSSDGSSSSSSVASPTTTPSTPQASPTATSGSSGNSGSSGTGGGSGNTGGNGGSSSSSSSSGNDGSSSSSSSGNGNSGGAGTGSSSSNSGSSGSSGSSSGSSGTGSSNESGGSGSSGQSSSSSGSSSGSDADSGSSGQSAGSSNSSSEAAAEPSPSSSAKAGAASSASQGAANEGSATPSFTAVPGLIQAETGGDSSALGAAAAAVAQASTYTGEYVSVATGVSGTTAVLYSHGVPISTATGDVIHSSGSPWATITDPFGPASTSSVSAASTGSSAHHGLAAGVIAGIVIAVLALCSLCLCCVVRRRAISKRLKARRNWISGPPRSGISNADYFAAHPNSNRASVQSTTSSFFDTAPDSSPPPMEQLSSINPATGPSTSPSPSSLTAYSDVWPSNLSGSICAPPAAATLDSEPCPTIRSPDRSAHRRSTDSAQSAQSDASDTLGALALYPVLPPQIATNVSPFMDYAAPLSPSMSVRPFSPSESWSFPKPPEGGSAHPGLDALHEDPFADDASVAHSAESVDAETASHFSRVETIRRAFLPTMPDEMAVAPGLHVRMLQRFDDGWALAEAVETGLRGLIPIDCLREAAQDLPTFLAAKRLSSYPSGGAHVPMSEDV